MSHGALKGRIHLQVRQPEAVDDLARKERSSIGRIDNITSWATMMQASLNYDEQYRVSAQFGAPVKKLIGQRIRLAGFVLPLQMNEAQTQFILSANPPTCFFHLPGGPTTVAEVNARNSTEIGWGPIVVEGRLEADTSSDDGIVYRLSDARVLAP